MICFLSKTGECLLNKDIDIKLGKSIACSQAFLAKITPEKIFVKLITKPLHAKK